METTNAPHQVEYDLATITGIDTGGRHIPIKGLDRLPEEAPVYDMDESYEFPKEGVRWLAYTLANPARIRLQFVGPPGCGKSSLIRELLARIKKPLLVVPCHEFTEPADLFGCWIAGENGMIHQYGPVSLAMQKGWAVVFEERDSLSAATQLALNSVMDTNMVVLAQFGGEVIKAAPGFVMLATANTNGTGDELGLHAASRVQPSSSNSRWHTVATDYLAPEKERALLSRKFSARIPEGDTPQAKAVRANFGEVVAKLVQFADETRQAAQGIGHQLPCHTRALVNALDVYMSMGSVRTAIEVCYLNQLGSADRAAAEESYKNHINLQDGVESLAAAAKKAAGGAK